MFITFFDKDFNALADNSSLNIESYKLIRRAYDLDAFDCVCEPISLDIEPMFATIKTNTGERYYDMLRPLIMREKNNRSSVGAQDLMKIFDTECVIDFTAFNGKTVKDYLNFIVDAWRDWDNSGIKNVIVNINGNINFNRGIDGEVLTTLRELYRPTDKAVYNVKELFSKTLATYDAYMESKIDIRHSAVVFDIKINNSRQINIRLEDYGIEDFGKYSPPVNTTVVYSDKIGFVPHYWFLLENGAITTNSSLRDIFPTRGKVFYVESGDKSDDEHAAEVLEADFEAISELAQNRYQETIEIESRKDPERLNAVNFGTGFRLYYKNKFYRLLPLGEIEESGADNKILRIGFKINDFIQLL